MQDIIGFSLIIIYVYLLLFHLDKLPLIVVSGLILTMILVFANGILRSGVGPFILGGLVIWTIYAIAKSNKKK